MDHAQCMAAICGAMRRDGLDLVVGIHDGSHFIETPNAVMVLAGFKSLGASAVIIDQAGETDLVVTPAWDAARAHTVAPGLRVTAADEVMGGLSAVLDRRGTRNARIGVAGHSSLPFSIAADLPALLPDASDADPIVFGAAAVKTDAEIANAREATRIAELAYERLLGIVEPGVSEDQLAVELRRYTRSLGADDNFLLLCAGPHNRAVAPSNGRKLEAGDIVLAEITPSVRGQLAQICRTIVLGRAPALLVEKYRLVVGAMDAGIAAAKPGAPMSAVCRAINVLLEAEGYGEFCHPPHIRRRGHGLGFACNEPGDVALDNDTRLAPGMVFMIHPNQYLPETGYLLCGEPVLMTEHGAEPLTAQKAALAELWL
jgi:Xaa-Pro aminopeptidase